MTDEGLARTIRELREALGLTQEQFAARIGMTTSTVNRWENGRGTPSPLALKQIEALRKKLKKSE
jgi:DNA-binding transcriptional regulator YiaG